MDNFCPSYPYFNLSWTHCQPNPPTDQRKDYPSNFSFTIKLTLKHVTSSGSINYTGSYGKSATVKADVGLHRNILLKPFSPGLWKSREFRYIISNPDSNLIEIPCLLLIKLSTSVGELNAHSQIANLYVNQLYCDITFCFDTVDEDEQIGGHITILSARSPVFATMFQNGMGETTTKKVSIKGIKPNIFKQLLHYVYSGRTSRKLSEEIAQPLFTAADMYDISDLKSECIRFLLSCIKLKNAINLMAWAHIHSVDTLKESSLAFVASHGEQICHQDDWEMLMKNYPDLCLLASRRMWQ